MNKKNLLGTGAALLFALNAGQAHAAIDPEDQKAINNAGCEELAKEYRELAVAEKKLDADIRKAKGDNTATNVLGVATFATLGIGFFSWTDHGDAEANLAEIREYRQAVAAAGAKKSCALPAP